MEYLEGMALIKKAADGDLEDKLWDRWLVDYQKMDKDTYKSFEDYKKELIANKKDVDNRSQEEIIEEILKSHGEEVR